MFKVVESWTTMERPMFVDIMHLLLYTKHIGARGTLDQYQQHVGVLVKDYGCARGGTGAELTRSPFVRFHGFVEKVRQFIRKTPLGGVRKITPLTPGQIKSAVEHMFVGGLSMLQARVPLMPLLCLGICPHLTLPNRVRAPLGP